MQLWRLGGQALALFEVAGLLRQRSEAAIPLDAPLGLLLLTFRASPPPPSDRTGGARGYLSAQRMHRSGRKGRHAFQRGCADGVLGWHVERMLPGTSGTGRDALQCVCADDVSGCDSE